ncbi:MAG: hypothetical protein JNK84_15610 [Phreatobacter sp.]|uniref:hypothetical protein n=1 Tax=Phreatobacter sp. TaxID=1966341 RepID=UPI001A587CF4|nr:hypothetical protein [Phreatobacter sp.]MBL8570497.1 hypothetical protein [Phreatobacter sp.]
MRRIEDRFNTALRQVAKHRLKPTEGKAEKGEPGREPGFFMGLHMFQWFWTSILRLPPTCFLQWEIEAREGIETFKVQIGTSLIVEISGPATVTVNRD